MSARRLTGWPERLAGYAAASASTPFAWGSHDCVTFAAGAVEATTGIRPAMPAWVSVRSAMRQLKQAGGLVAAVESVGLEPLARPQLAARGDVVLVDHEDAPQPFLAVCLGHVWAAPGSDGLVYGPMSVASRGWKVA
jgi:hypothetical protein